LLDIQKLLWLRTGESGLWFFRTDSRVASAPKAQNWYRPEAIGRVVQDGWVGGPHRLNGERPEWFSAEKLAVFWCDIASQSD